MTGSNGFGERLVRAASPGITTGEVGFYALSVLALTASDANVASFAPGVTKPDLRFSYGYAELVVARAAPRWLVC